MKRAKLAINLGLDVDINSGCQIEASLFGLCFGQEQQEGMSAFLERRLAQFK